MKAMFTVILLFVSLITCSLCVAESPASLWPVVDMLQSREFVDLTHCFKPGIPHWPGFEDELRTTTFYYDEGMGSRGKGFLAHKYEIPGQWGTHADPPAHFVRGKRFLDEISVKEMILPLVVIDVSDKVKTNHNYQITMTDVSLWEARHGRIPAKSFVAMRTDWSKRWPSAEKMQNIDDSGVAHYPGWSQEVLSFLYEERDITASGHETTDTDPGVSTSKGDYSLETYVLSRNKYQIELLTNLDKVPEHGAIAVVTFPKPCRGSGFPARVFAILPSASAGSVE